MIRLKFHKDTIKQGRTGAKAAFLIIANKYERRNAGLFRGGQDEASQADSFSLELGDLVRQHVKRKRLVLFHFK